MRIRRTSNATVARARPLPAWFAHRSLRVASKVTRHTLDLPDHGGVHSSLAASLRTDLFALPRPINHDGCPIVATNAHARCDTLFADRSTDRRTSIDRSVKIARLRFIVRVHDGVLQGCKQQKKVT